MNIHKFATEIGRVLAISMIPGGDRFGGSKGEYWYHCEFNDTQGRTAEVYERKGGQTNDHFGIGKSPEEAIADYVRRIRGKCLHFDTFTPGNHVQAEEVDVPRTLRAKPLPGSDNYAWYSQMDEVNAGAEVD